MLRSGLLLLLLALAVPARADTTDAVSCGGAIRASEQAARLPRRMLEAIGLVESGRPDPVTHATVSWPWTIDVAGTPHVYDNEADAILAVRAAQAAGTHSIDVGCMQINLLHHPHAFASLDEAFDPIANANYATIFIRQLHGRMGNWADAVAAYHSQTPALGAAYVRRVASFWPLAASFGVKPNQAIPRPPDPDAGIDPQHVMTPEFRARLIRDAAFRRARDLAMGLTR